MISEVTAEDYHRAENFLPQNIRKLVMNAEIKADWIGKSDRFWYKRRSRTGSEFILVDPSKNLRLPAFDHQRLAVALSQITKTAYEQNKLPFDTIVFAQNGGAIRFEIEDTFWTYDLKTYRCTKSDQKDETFPDQLSSPDGQWAVFVRDHDLYLRSINSDQETRLTTDGVLHNEYASYAEADTSWVTRKRTGEKMPPLAVWSPDSKKIITHRLDQRKVKELHLLQYVPPDGSFRPVLHTYRVPFAGDQELSMAAYVIFDVVNRTKTWVEYEPQPVQCEPSLAYQRVWWSGDGKKVYIIYNERDDKTMRLCEVEADSGKTKLIFEEKRESTHIDLHPVLGARPNVRVVSGTDEVLWFSERDGWAHLYLYDGITGSLKNRITSGDWAVDEIKRVDERNRWVYFTARGREGARDPYYRHLYRAKLDGSKLDLLTPEDGDHDTEFSPSGLYFIDTFSRVDCAPISVLRSREGMLLRVLEKADISLLLETGWKFPERFCAKARDGTTDIFGVIHRPTTFDPSKTYPVIDGIYPGPQAIRTPKAFTDTFRYRDCALSELGFIVVTVDGMGTPFRSKAFHDFSYGNLGDAGGLADHIAALRQLSLKYSFMDLNKVGIYGHSGGGYAAARAILAYPDFYKVAVSSAGNHDARGYVADWLEKYLGLPKDNNYQNQSNVPLAPNLKGKLLLACGDMDDNVHPAMTLQLVDALIKANKDFDFLMLPNSNHSFRPHREYFIRKTWDYFVKHLLGTEPPKDYRIKPFSSQ
ncbi:MAG: DPP IV N-terminal domain-containing protein [Candidatus Aminicenantes bacterium]|nr:DPP IV N-terminal domain-containing protein [Candidatus Aminicenantes bacterium]